MAKERKPAKELKNHFAVTENIHRATKSVSSECKQEINELVGQILLTDPRIKSAYNRIVGGK